MENPVDPKAATAASKNPADTKADEVVNLEDIDRILSEDDPTFTQSLADINEKIDPSVDIESLNLSEDGMSVESVYVETESLVERFPKLKFVLIPLQRLQGFWSQHWIKILSLSISLYRQTLIWLQTRPKEFLLYLSSMAKATVKVCGELAERFRALSWLEKTGVVTVLSLTGAALFVLWLNLGGIWIPGFWRGPLNSLDVVATENWSVVGEPWVPLYASFPQKEFKFQFRQMVVNLRPSSGHNNPMGYFEFYVDVDSEVTAVEVRSRENELHDLVQRTVEEFTYPELEGVPGKERLKIAIQKELNNALSQGWVNGVLIKGVVIKP